MSDSRGDWSGEDLDASRDVAAMLLMLAISQRRGDCEMLLAAAEAEGRTDALLRQALCELKTARRAEHGSGPHGVVAGGRHRAGW